MNLLELFLTLRPKLFGIAYRMMGSASEAEDILQEAWLRFQAIEPSEIRSPEALLTTIVTRLCLDQLKSAQRKRELYPGIWLPEPLPTAEQLGRGTVMDDPLDSVIKEESISLAFLYLLESLGVEERAVFLLREVFEYPYNEIAHFVQKSEAACRQLFSRAKKQIGQKRAHQPANASDHQRVFTSFLQAVQQGELESLLSIMAEDVVCYSDGGGKASAATRPLAGRETVARFVKGIQRTGFKPGDQVEFPLINSRQAVLIRNAQGQVVTVICVEVGEGLIQGLYIVRNPDKLGRV